MINIEFVSPYKEFNQIAEKAFFEYPSKGNVNFILSDLSFSQLKQHRFLGDVIIARGLAADYLNKLYLGRNIVLELPMTGYDIIRAIYKGLGRTNAKSVAVIATEHVIYGIRNSNIPLPVQVSTYVLHNLADTSKLITHAIEQGNDLIIGGDAIASECQERHICCERIDVGEESIHQVTDEAIRIFNSNREERLRAERFKALIENIDEGIISCDVDKRITFCNDFVKNIFFVDQPVLEGANLRNIHPLLDEPPLDSLLEPEIDKVLTISNIEVALNRIPVRVNNKFVSGIIVFQKLSKIHKIETQFRSNKKRSTFYAKYSFNNILGNNPKIVLAKQTAENYSHVDANVLIIGETGTGKELFAQSIHNASNRSDKPFVAVNCAAIPASLLESELFGYSAGAFTGASKEGKMGLFEMAHTGTIFLDEISEMSMELQGRLLRIIEQREILRIGHNQVIPIDIRIIAATNRDIQELVNKNLFRKDLFYRLDVLRLSLPQLKQMKSDIPLLMKHYLKHYEDKHKTINHMLDTSCFDFLERQEWPGNTRQLRNLCERLTTVVTGSIIGLNEVSQCFDGYSSNTIDNNTNEEFIQLKNALEQTNNNKSQAANLLGIDRTTLYRRLKKHNLV